jgi:inorganic triphosphatase YgiF
MSGHDHPGAAPIEVELRFLAAAGLPTAAKIAGLEPAGMCLIERGEQRLHSDVYCDTVRLGLRAAGANLRVRTGSLGERWVTLKQKTRGGHKGAVNIRLEAEVLLPPGALAEDSEPWLAARALTTREIRPMLHVATLREEHLFGDRHGNRAVMALDMVTYPDGSVEHRLEVEMREGTPQLLRVVEDDLRRKVRGLKAAPRGKRSEAIRRLPQLVAGAVTKA